MYKKIVVDLHSMFLSVRLSVYLFVCVIEIMLYVFLFICYSSIISLLHIADLVIYRGPGW